MCHKLGFRLWYSRPAHAGRLPLVLPARRGGRDLGRDARRLWGRGSAGRLGRRTYRLRDPRRGMRGHPARSLRGVPPLQGLLLVRAGSFSTPRPAPGRRAPALAGAGVVVLALPVFLVGAFPLGGWALAAVLWC